ncbi:MAG: zf-HC2 domain-containing protein [Candidatus Aminicenantes bacterium]|nr:MAG: zf-HC2 domain-containing protein [Candidatus Aminicenantes bacterium]
MMECKKIRKDLVAFLYGELEGKEKIRFTSHLDSCPQCKSELEQLRVALNGANSLKPNIEETMASVDWEALPSRITDYVFKEEVRFPQESWFTRLTTFLIQPKLRPVLAGILLGVLIGSFTTYMIFKIPQPGETQTAELFAPQDFLERVELQMARKETINYLEESQYLLLDFAEFPSKKKAEFWRSEFTSQRARKLLAKKKYINPQLSKFKMAKAKAICDQIELLFYELSQISVELSIEQVEEIQRLIDEKQLLLKIKLLKKELEESEV